MTHRFHVRSQDMQGQVYGPVMIVVTGYLITIAQEELLYFNSSPSKKENGRLQQTHLLRIYLVKWRSQSSTCRLLIISLCSRGL